LADAKTPGTSPSKLEYIQNYQPYTTLQEWEQLKSGLSKEVVPHKRSELHEYTALSGAGHTQRDTLSAGEHAVAALELLPELSGVERRIFSGERSAGVEADRRPVKLPSPTVSDRTPSDMSVRVAGKMVVSSPPYHFEDPHPDMSTPRYAQDPSTPRYAQAPDDVPVERHYAPSRIKVSRVALNAVVQYDPPQASNEKPRVTDKDRVLYPHARHIRPARKTNNDSKKRLNELLKLRGVRLEAGDLHPSRSFGIVPSQNLRVV
jgi:hypothetical protein